MSQTHHTEDENLVDQTQGDLLQKEEAFVEETSETLQSLETSPMEEGQETVERLRALIEETQQVTGEMRAILEQQQRISGLQKPVSKRRQSIPYRVRQTSDAYREEMQSHAAGLEKFGSDANHATQGRPANYHVIHEGNIKKDEEAVRFLAQHHPYRLKHACEGFEILYGISVSEYDNLQIATAPDDIVNAFNKKSDMNHFHFSQARRNPQLKNWLVSICDAIINQWKRHISSSGEEVLRIEHIRGQNDCLEKEISNMF